MPANNNDLLCLKPPTFPDKHKDSFAKDRDELLAEVRDMRAAIERIRISGHYSAKGLAAEIGARLAAHSKELMAFRQRTIDRIDKHVREETTRALTPKQSTEDPQVRFQRLHAKRELLAREDPTKLWQRLRQAIDNGGGEELIAALTLLEPEFPIAPPELIEQTRRAIAERTHPELGEMASLRAAYTSLIGTAAEEAKTLAAAHGVDLQHASGQAPYLVSTGAPVPTAAKE